MNFKTAQVLEDQSHYDVSLIELGSVLLLTWKGRAGVTDEIYMEAILAIARHSREHKPQLVLIDRRKRIDNAKFDREWWSSEIIPKYHEAGFVGMAHIISNTARSGEVDNPPPGLRFKIGEFSDVESALRWEL